MTDKLSLEDIQKMAEAMAPILIGQIRAEHHEFWIDPETHYKSHLASDNLAKIFDPDMVAALKEISKNYRAGKGIIWKMFMMLVAAGAIWFAVQGWLHGKFFDGG